MNARETEIISRLLGLFLPKRHIAVDTIITPPVTMGYCTDAWTCASASTKIKFATLLILPLAAATAPAPSVYLGIWYFPLIASTTHIILIFPVFLARGGQKKVFLLKKQMIKEQGNRGRRLLVETVVLTADRIPVLP